VGCDLNNVIRTEYFRTTDNVVVCLNILLKLLKGRVREQNTKRNIVVKEIISLLMRKSGSEILIIPNDNYCYYSGRFRTKILGTPKYHHEREFGI
jgi:hypothetical protein